MVSDRTTYSKNFWINPNKSPVGYLPRRDILGYAPKAVAAHHKVQRQKAVAASGEV